MCGKFTEQASWAQVHDFSQPLSGKGGGGDPVVSKALLKTSEGVTWTAAPEPKKPRARKS